MKSRRTRIFWCHPRLMDYRKPLFDLVHGEYEVTFFFQQRDSIEAGYHAVYGRNRIAGRLLSPGDVIQLYRGIKESDVFISSFLSSDYSLVGIIIARLLRRRFIVWEELAHFFTGVRSTMRRWVSRIAARYVDAFFVLGEPQRRALCRLGVPRAKIFIANEYPGHVYSEIEAKEIQSLTVQDREVILYLGRFISVKGIDYLLEAYRRLEAKHSRTLLLVVGYGPLKEAIEEQAARLGIENVRFLGPITDIRQKKYLFEISRMLVVPSVIQKGKGIEGGPLVVLEALSAGTPVLGTDGLISSTQFISNGVNGFIVPHSDSQALYEKMEEIINWQDPEAVRQRVRAGFRTIKGFEHQFGTLKRAIEHCRVP